MIKCQYPACDAEASYKTTYYTGRTYNYCSVHAGHAVGTFLRISNPVKSAVLITPEEDKCFLCKDKPKFIVHEKNLRNGETTDYKLCVKHTQDWINDRNTAMSITVESYHADD